MVAKDMLYCSYLSSLHLFYLCPLSGPVSDLARALHSVDVGALLLGRQQWHYAYLTHALRVNMAAVAT